MLNASHLKASTTQATKQHPKSLWFNGKLNQVLCADKNGGMTYLYGMDMDNYGKCDNLNLSLNHKQIQNMETFQTELKALVASSTDYDPEKFHPLTRVNKEDTTILRAKVTDDTRFFMYQAKGDKILTDDSTGTYRKALRNGFRVNLTVDIVPKAWEFMVDGVKKWGLTLRVAEIVLYPQQEVRATESISIIEAIRASAQIDHDQDMEQEKDEPAQSPKARSPGSSSPPNKRKETPPTPSPKTKKSRTKFMEFKESEKLLGGYDLK